MRRVSLRAVSLAIDARDTKNMLLGAIYIRCDRKPIRTEYDYAFCMGTINKIRDLLQDYSTQQNHISI
jgi:hypothetical protein